MKLTIARSLLGVSILVGLVALAMVFVPHRLSMSHDEDCGALAGSSLGHVRIITSAVVAKGDLLRLWSGGKPIASPVRFCRVRAISRPVSRSTIGIELWLPLPAVWNGKYLQRGNGGFAGTVPLTDLLEGVQRGYAAAATDGGHVAANGLRGSWALHNRQSVIDFGWRAVAETSAASRKIIGRYYGKQQRLAYFVGCSDGGRDAMVAAQRLPSEFNGIVAGSPAMNWVDLMSAGALIQKKTLPPKNVFDIAALRVLQSAALKACAHGRSYISDPLACRFDPATTLCKPGQSSGCLDAAQVALARQIYAGVKDPVTGKLLPGTEPGAEAEAGNWDFWVMGAPQNGPKLSAEERSMPEQFFRYFVREDPQFDLQSLTVTDLAEAHRLWSADLDATNPDLRAFRDRGGKLIQYQGWSDAAVPPRATLAYYKTVAGRMNHSEEFFRLFMIPGMNHCAGGPAPWQADWLQILEQWVEHSNPPASVALTDPRTRATIDLGYAVPSQ